MNASNEVIPKDKYKTSRVMYILWAAFEYFISICTSGAYLAKLTSSIGITDSMTALISTLASLAGSFQVIAILLAHKTPVKRWVVPIQFVFQAMLASLFLIPFLNFGPHAGIVVFVIFLVANALKNIALPVKSAWFINLTDPKTRGLFQSILNIVSLIGGMAFTLFISRVIDSYEARGDIKGAFLVLTVIIFICTVLDIIVLLISKEKPTEIKDHVSPLGEVKNLLRNKKYVNFIIVHALWSLTSSITSSFLGTYQIKELGFSMTFISTLTVVTNFLTMICIYFCGRYSVRHAFLPLLRVGYTLSSLAYVIVIFTTPANGKFMYIIYAMINLLGSSAITIGNNIMYKFTRPVERTAAIAINTILTGLVAFFTTLLITPLFNYIKDVKGSFIFGRTIYAQQLLAALSVTIGLILIIFLYTKFTKVINATPDEEED